MKIIKVGAVWCPGCLVMKKTWNKIKNDYNDIEIIDIDYDINKEEIEKYNVGREIPVTIFIDKNEQEIFRVRGEQEEKFLREMIDKYRWM